MSDPKPELHIQAPFLTHRNCGRKWLVSFYATTFGDSGLHSHKKTNTQPVEKQTLCSTAYLIDFSAICGVIYNSITSDLSWSRVPG